MLHLPEITLFAIDCVSPNRTTVAMRHSSRWIKWGRIILLKNKTRNYDVQPQFGGLEIIHLEETDRKVSPFPGHPLICVDYDRDMMTKTVDYCSTPYLLHMEYDSAVLNPRAWDNHWLEYDFIAPPWPPHNDPGWPPCTDANNVGSFGFCLGSRKFWQGCRDAYEYFSKQPGMAQQIISSDRFICRTARPWLELRGIKFAPVDEAMRFANENLIHSGQFGFHGKGTAAMNGWTLPIR